VLEAVLRDVGYVHRWLRRQEEEWLQHRLFFLRQRNAARGPSLVEDRAHFVQHGDDALGFLVAAVFATLP